MTIQRLGYLLTFCILSFWASGQKVVTQGEYFWDTDPGQGNGTALEATDGNFGSVIENMFKNGIDVSGLSYGAHSFNVRIKGQDATWSSVFRQTIYLETPLTTITRAFKVTQGEYFWDTDPGQGNATPLLATDGNFSSVMENMMKTTDASTLTVGAHSLAVRTLGFDGSWSPLFRQTVYVECVNPTAPAITVTVAGNGACTGANVQFNATIVNGGTAPVYHWKLNGSDVGTNAPAYANASLANGDVVTCELVSNSTCATTPDATSNAIVVSLSSPAAPTVSITANPGSNICAGTTVTFTAAATNGGSAPVYQWKLNGANAGTNSPTFTSSSLLSGDVVSCELISNAPCATPTTAVSAGVTMTVTNITAPTISIAASATTVCTGTNVTFTATITGGGNSPVYQWKLNGAPVGTNSSVFSSSTLSSGNIVTCELTSSLTCLNSPSVLSNQITMNIPPTVTPTISITASNTNICSGTNVTFTAAITNGGSSPVYQWYLNGAPVGTSSATYSNNALADGNTVYCTLASSVTCPSAAIVNSNSVAMTVTTSVTPSITVSASATAICAGTSVTFTAASVNGGTPTYQWKVNNTVVGTNSNTFTSATLNNGDLVTCKVTSSLTCVTAATATSAPITMTVTAISPASVSIASSAGAAICGGTSVTFTATPANGGATPVYQWMLNGSPVGTNSATYANATLANADLVTCEMTSSLACPSPATATSNGIAMTVSTPVTPSVAIASNLGNIICNGVNVVFTATPTNGGTAPVYQWMLNGSPVGTNSSTYSNATLASNDVVSCVLTSNLSCVTAATATSNDITMTITAPLTPTVSIAASAMTICAGTSITFTATATNGGTTPAYQWKVNGGNAGTNSSTFSSTILTNGDVVTCELTSSLSCVTASSATSNSIAVTVNPVVAASVTISSGSGTSICAGASVTFTATPANSGTPVYQWMLNGSPVGTNSATYVNSALASGDVVSCEMTSSLACPSPATAISNSITMTVNSTVTPTISIASSGGNSICSGTSVTFTATATNGGTAPAYQWMLNGSPVGTNSATYVNAALANNDAVSCVLTSNAPCPTTATATSNTVTMTVAPAIAASVSISASATNICAGTTVTFTATPANGGTPAYQWKVNGGNVGTNSSTYTTSALTNGAVVTCLMTSSLGCATPAPATSNAITVTVSASGNPTISITKTPNTATICSGTLVTFTAAITNGGASPAYQWKLNGTNVGTSTSVYTSNALANGDVVSCVLTSGSPCAATPTVTSNNITMNIVQSVTPTITVTCDPVMPVCESVSVTLTTTITNGGTFPTYQWKKNGQNYGTNSATYSPFTWNDGDVFTCQLTSNAACATSAQVISNGITMDIISINSNVTVSGNTLTAAQAGATYQWFECGFQQPIAGATQQTFTPATSGNYGVHITMGSCSEDSGCEYVNVNSLDELSAGGIKLYPNPAADQFTLELPYDARMSMTMYDLAGRKVMEQTFEGATQQIDVQHLATGSYRLVLSDGNREYAGKVMVSH